MPLYNPTAGTTSSNTFTKGQTITPTAAATTALTLNSSAADTPSSYESWLVSLNAYGGALTLTHNHDWSQIDTNPHDLADLFLKSTGDGIFLAHQGGVLPSGTFTATTSNTSTTLASVSSFALIAVGTVLSGTGIQAGTTVVSVNTGASTLVMSLAATASGSITVTAAPPSGSTGGNAGLNVLVPYDIDDTTTGRAGSVVNNRTGMRGLFIDYQATAAGEPAFLLRNHGDTAAIKIENQQTGAGVVTSTGRSFQIEEYGTASSFLLNANTQVDSATGKALIDLRALWTNSGAAASAKAVQVVDSNGKIRWSVDTKGIVILNDGTRDRISLDPTGTLVTIKDASGNTRRTVDGNGAEFMYNVSGQQVGATSPQANSDGYFIFGRAGGAAVIGFYGTTPIVKPTVTGSRGANAALASALTALANLGLLTDSSTA